MKNGYDQFFKQAKKAAATPGYQPKPARSRLEVRLSEEDVENQLRRRMNVPSTKKKKPKKPFPWLMTIISVIGLGGAYWGTENFEKVERFVKNIEITLNGQALAEDAPAKEASKEVKSDSGAAAVVKKEEVPVKDPNQMTDEELNHLTHLNDKKKELDAKEEELNRMEQELAAQKTELEKRMKELDEMRRGISSVLEEKVKVDTEKLDTLVQMYTNMKAPQAAKVFEEMDEDLAVEILSKMKRKNAADILNLLKPEKARSFSEKFAGYKRK